MALINSFQRLNSNIKNLYNNNLKYYFSNIFNWHQINYKHKKLSESNKTQLIFYFIIRHYYNNINL